MYECPKCQQRYQIPPQRNGTMFCAQCDGIPRYIGEEPPRASEPESMIVACGACGRKNRVPKNRPGTIHCGHCRKPISVAKDEPPPDGGGQAAATDAETARKTGNDSASGGGQKALVTCPTCGQMNRFNAGRSGILSCGRCGQKMRVGSDFAQENGDTHAKTSPPGAGSDLDAARHRGFRNYVQIGWRSAGGLLLLLMVLQLTGVFSVTDQIDYLLASPDRKINIIRAGALLDAVREEDVAESRKFLEQLFGTFDPLELQESTTWERDRLRTRNGRLVHELAAQSPNPEIVAVFSPMIDENRQEDYLRHYAGLMDRAVARDDFYTAYQAAVAFHAFDRVLKARRRTHRTIPDMPFYIGAFAAWSGVEELQSGNARYWLEPYDRGNDGSRLAEQARAILEKL